MWTCLPALHAALAAKIINPAAWGAILILTIAPLPLSAIDARTFAAREAERQEQASPARIEREKAETRERAITRFQAVTPDTSLGDYLLAPVDYTYYLPDEAGQEETLAKGRRR
jgi:hypothetical protein